MSNFDIKFEPVYSDEDSSKINSFSITFIQKNHNIALGYYAVYPSIDRKELILIPEFVFHDYKKRFEEISEKIARAEKERANGVKEKNRRYFVTEEEAKEAKKLRSIISNSKVFKITGSETSVSLPGKYLEMLEIKDDDFLTFVQSGSNEYLIINPNDAWMFSDKRNFNYSDESEEYSPKALFGRLKKAI